MEGAVVEDGEVLGLDLIAVAHDEGALHDVPQLADVAGPAVLQEDGLGPGGEGLLVLVGVVQLVDDGPGELGDVALALAQGRDPDGEDAQTVEEVLAEGALGDAALQIAVRGGDDAGVDLDGAAAADAGDLPLLEDAQELGLGGEGQLADLVEEDGALVGDLEETGLALAVGPGEGAALVAEQLALGKVLGDRAAVDADEVLPGAGGALVDVRRDALLADAGLALDEDDGVELGGAADDAQEVERRGILGDELRRGEELVADDGHLLLEAGGEPLLVVQPLL